MKLSDVKGDRTLDVIADLIEPVANIAQDEEAAAAFKPQAVPDGMDAKTFFASRMCKHVPALLKSHKDDVIAIMATIEGVDVETYADSLNLVKIVKDFAELITDEVFLDFLASNKNATEKDVATERSENSEAH